MLSPSSSSAKFKNPSGSKKSTTSSRDLLPTKNDEEYYYEMARYQSVSDLISSFSWIFHKSLAESWHCPNLIFSPITVSSCIFSILLGSDGLTRNELNDIFVTGGNEEHFSEEFERINKILKKLKFRANNNNENNGKYGDNDDPASSATAVAGFESFQRLFYSKGDRLLDEYMKQLQTCFEIDSQAVDFTARNNTFRKMTSWLESSGVVLDTTCFKDALNLASYNRLVFVSSVKFQGCLDLDLNKSRQEALFHINDVERISTRMLGAETEMDYAVLPKIDARAVSIPLKGSQCVLMIFLPKGRGGLEQLEHSLRNYQTLAQIVNSFQTKRRLHFYLPPFNFDQILNFNEATRLLGASTIFDQNFADFGRMEETPENIFVSGLIQNVHFRIFEELDNSYPPDFDLKSKKSEEALDFHVEHPFFFIVYDKLSKIMLMAGRVTNPLRIPYI